jgi:exodeoxyribonuclease V
MKFKLTDEQKNVIKTFMKFLINPDERFMIIQGAAGTGKTTMIKYMLRAIEKEFKLLKTLLCEDPDGDDFTILMTAMTNKAVSVLRELTGEDEVRTIHSTIGLMLKKDFSLGTEYLVKTKRFKEFDSTIIILDEASMLDDETFGFMDEALGKKSKAVLIGDVFQLAPINQKWSMMQKIQCPTAVMNKVLRHAGPILETASIFRNVVKTSVFQNIPTSNKVIHVDGSTFQQEVEMAFLDPKYKNNDVKVLAWSNERVQAYNHHIRKAKGLPQHLQEGEIAVTNKMIMNKGHIIPVDSEVEITWVGPTRDRSGIPGNEVQVDSAITGFMPNDFSQAKILMKNIARKAKTTKQGPERSELWKRYFLIKDSWLDLRSSYASTVHKSQGSSYDRVFIDLYDIGKCNIPSDTARMLYVAISRAKTQVILYGSLPPKYRGRLAA